MIRKGQLVEMKRKILPILKQSGVKHAGFFGSFARGEANKTSDIDMLVELETGKNLLDLVRLERELKKALGKDVDLVTYNSLNHLLRNRILSEEVKII